jgi:hypothetical protein
MPNWNSKEDILLLGFEDLRRDATKGLSLAEDTVRFHC